MAAARRAGDLVRVAGRPVVSGLPARLARCQRCAQSILHSPVMSLEEGAELRGCLGARRRVGTAWPMARAFCRARSSATRAAVRSPRRVATP